MNNGFKDLSLAEPIQRALKDMGFQEPTEVQARAIPHALNGDDVIVMSKTGSGKTAVFGVSILQLTDPAELGPQCLILVPTRELAVQVHNDLQMMAKYLAHTSTVVYGQHNMNTEIKELEKYVTIVTGTPGRVYDHIQHGNLKTDHIKFLVLDEVDRMMDMGFIDQVRRIVRTLPKNRITLLFSATIPEEVARLCRQYMREPVTIEIESETRTVDTVIQKYYRVEKNEKRTQLNRLLLMEQPDTCMIFCNTKVAVDQVQSYLTRKGYASRALHGDIPQNKRMKNITQFKRGTYHILVATDVAARGIHVEDLSLVINYDVPVELDSYIHRIGRTGRAGHNGRAISLVTVDDIMTMYAIEEHIGTLIPEAKLPSDEDLAERKAEIDAWIKANAITFQPDKQSAGSDSGSSRDGQRNPSRKKPYQKKRGQKQEQNWQTDGTPKDRNRQPQQGDGKRLVAGNQQLSAAQGKAGSNGRNKDQYRENRRPPYNGKQKSTQAVGNEQGTAVRSGMAASTRVDKSAEVKAVQAGAGKNEKAAASERMEKATQPQENTGGKSLLKRIFDRLLGK